MVDDNLAALPVRYGLARLRVDDCEGDVRREGVEDARRAAFRPARSPATPIIIVLPYSPHIAVSGKISFLNRLRESGSICVPAPADCLDLRIHQVHQHIVAGDSLEQRRGDREEADILSAQHIDRLLDDMTGVGLGVVEPLVGDEPFDPARIQVDRKAVRACGRAG